MRDGGQDVHVWDVARRTIRQLTFDPIPNFLAVWLDNQQLAFWAGTELRPQVSVLAADGSSAPRQLTKNPNLSTYPMSASRDGKLLLVIEMYKTGGNGIGVIPPREPEKRQTLKVPREQSGALPQ